MSDATRERAPTLFVHVATSQPYETFLPGAVGLATETKELESGRLSATNSNLVQLMKLLGPSVLRIGGNSVDSSWWSSDGEPTPYWATNTTTPADLATLNTLLVATGWKVLLSVDLGQFEPARAADEASYASQILGRRLLGVEIGNEPNDFGAAGVHLRSPAYNVGQYIQEANAYVHAIQTAAPGVATDGPALTQATTWLSRLGVATTVFAGITQHFYASSTCPGSQPIVSPTIGGLLSVRERQLENRVLGMLSNAERIARRPIRIGETNTVSCLGSSASSSFASALWALDWSLRAASSGVQGLNFAGELGLCATKSESPICVSSAQPEQRNRVTAQPEFYGLLAARQLERGRFVRTRLMGPHQSFVAWATVSPTGTLKLALENLRTTGANQPVKIAVPAYRAISYEVLTAPSLSARRDVRLHETNLGHLATSKYALTGASYAPLSVAPATAVIVTLVRATSDQPASS